MLAMELKRFLNVNHATCSTCTDSLSFVSSVHSKNQSRRRQLENLKLWLEQSSQIPSGTASVEYAMASGYQRELFIATQMKSSATKQCPYFQSISLMRLHTGMKISFHLFSRERTLLCWKLLHNIYMCFLPITGCRKVL